MVPRWMSVNTHGLLANMTTESLGIVAERPAEG